MFLTIPQEVIVMKKLSLFALLSAAALSMGAHAQTPASPAATPAVTAAKTVPAEVKAIEAAKPVAPVVKHGDEAMKDKKAEHQDIIKVRHASKSEHKATAATPATPAAPATAATPAEPAKK